MTFASSTESNKFLSFKLLEKVEPLAEEIIPSRQEGCDPFAFSLLQLEALRKRGKSLRVAAARMLRQEANTHYTQAGSLSGKEADELYERAKATWTSLELSGGIESINAMCNLAALALQQKK